MWQNELLLIGSARVFRVFVKALEVFTSISSQASTDVVKTNNNHKTKIIVSKQQGFSRENG